MRAINLKNLENCCAGGGRGYSKRRSPPSKPAKKQAPKSEKSKKLYG